MPRSSSAWSRRAFTSKSAMQEGDDFIAFGTEIWDYDVAKGRDDEFKFGLVNSGVVPGSEEIETEPAS